MAGIYNQDRLNETESFRKGSPAVLAPTPKVTAMAPNAGEFTTLPMPVSPSSKSMGNTAFGDWMRSPDRGDAEVFRAMRGGEKLGARSAIVPQVKYTQPAGTPVAAPEARPSMLGTLGMAPAVQVPPSAIIGPTVANAANLPPVAAPRPMSNFVSSQVDQSLPQVSALPAAPRPDLSTGTMAIQPGRLSSSDRGIFVNGAKQNVASGTDPRALEEFNANARVNADQPEFRNGQNAGYVGQASSNAPGTRAINMGGMATVDEALAALSGGVQQKAAWTPEGIAAAKADPARQVHFVPRGPETRESAISGPRFVRAPSRAERVAQVANQGAIDLAGVTGKTSVDVAKQGALTAVEQAKATEAEKTRRSDDMIKGKEIEAKGRVDAVIAGKKEEASNKFNSVSPADVATAVSDYAGLRDNPVTYSLAWGAPTKADEAAYKTDLSKAKAKLAAFGVDENGKKITDEAAMPGKTKPESTDEPEGTIIKNQKTGSRFVKKNGEWMPIK
jgi:hypothetical protein